MRVMRYSFITGTGPNGVSRVRGATTRITSPASSDSEAA
jgi:hypothetical protein